MQLAAGTVPVSVFVLTLDESRNIERCLDGVAWAAERFVLDSFSSDDTVALAEAKGATVVQRRFDDWSSHQNFALGSLPFSQPWALYLDADEIPTAELAASIAAAVTDDRSPNVAYRLRRRDHLFGRRIDHAQATAHYIRLFRPEKVRYERLAHPITMVDGAIGDLVGDLSHYPMSHGIGQWLRKHVGYADLEAKQVVVEGAGQVPLRSVPGIARRDGLRHGIKAIYSRLPGRPLLRFAYLYVARGGFRDGRAGFRIAVLNAWYEYAISLHKLELQGAFEPQGDER